MDAAKPGQHRCHSQAMSYRAKLGFQFLIGLEGQVWRWNHGQETLANSGEAIEWVRQNACDGGEKEWLLTKLAAFPNRGGWESRVDKKYQT